MVGDSATIGIGRGSARATVVANTALHGDALSEGGNNSVISWGRAGQQPVRPREQSPRATWASTGLAATYWRGYHAIRTSFRRATAARPPGRSRCSPPRLRPTARRLRATTSPIPPTDPPAAHRACCASPVGPSARCASGFDAPPPGPPPLPSCSRRRARCRRRASPPSPAAGSPASRRLPGASRARGVAAGACSRCSTCASRRALIVLFMPAGSDLRRVQRRPPLGAGDQELHPLCAQYRGAPSSWCWVATARRIRRTSSGDLGARHILPICEDARAGRGADRRPRAGPERRLVRCGVSTAALPAMPILPELFIGRLPAKTSQARWPTVVAKLVSLRETERPTRSGATKILLISDDQYSGDHHVRRRRGRHRLLLSLATRRRFQQLNRHHPVHDR